jgi:hypothetical protein
MNNCEPFTAKLLPYLYDLLDSDERQALQAHLETCAACRTALERAQSQRKILAVAAKAEFPNVHFQPPVVTPANRENQIGVAQPERRPRRAWRWAIAAGILIAIGLGSGTALWGVRDWQLRAQAKVQEERLASLQAENARLVAEQQAAINRAAKDATDASQEVDKVITQYQEKLTALQKTISSRDLNVVVAGPERIQPGTNNQFQIQTLNKVNRPVNAEVSARVRDQRNQVVFEKEVSSSGATGLSLPADLPVTPDSNLSLEIVARREGNAESRVSEQLSLVSPVYLTHLYTDKPMYRPGETVRFRSLTLERFSLKPPQENFEISYRITNPNGEEVFHLEAAPRLVSQTGTPILGPDKQPLRGIGAGEFRIDPNAKGGEYTLAVREQQGRFPPQERKFIVNQYENPRLNKELDFSRKSYGPGDEVAALCKVSRAEGGTPVARRPVTAHIYIDGRPYDADGKEGNKPISLQTDEKGKVAVRFKLPAQIERGQGSLSVEFSDGANVETLVRPIPIALKKLQIEFFPEGGDLVADVPNRVYFQARTTLGKPAEITGRVVDQEGKPVVAQIQTLNDDKEPGVNQGMGIFAFTPASGKKYELKIDSPVGIEGKYELPEVKKDGVALQIENAVSQSKDAIHAVVYSGQSDRRLLVGAYCRGRLMDHRTVAAKKGEATGVDLRPGSLAGGVYRITVFEEKIGDANRRQLVPRAERLIYHSPGQQLTLNATPDHKQYTPGEKVKLSLKAQNEREKETAAVLLVSVVDKSVITLADEKTARLMPTHFLLTTEVRRPEDLEYADFLLGSHPKAGQALDLLLGTQGWRRFAEQNPGQFREKFGDDAGRLLAMMGQNSQTAVTFAQLETNRLQQDSMSQLAALQEKWAGANQTLQAAQSGEALGPRFQSLRTELASAQDESSATANRLTDHRESAKAVGVGLLIIVAAIFLVFSAVQVLIAIHRKFSFAVPVAVGAGIVAIFVVTFVVQLGYNFAPSPSARRNAFPMARAPVGEAAPAAPGTAFRRVEIKAERPPTRVGEVRIVGNEVPGKDMVHRNQELEVLKAGVAGEGGGRGKPVVRAQGQLLDRQQEALKRGAAGESIALGGGGSRKGTQGAQARRPSAAPVAKDDWVGAYKKQNNVIPADRVHLWRDAWERQGIDAFNPVPGLRREQKKTVTGGTFGEAAEEPSQQAPLILREYAHQHAPSNKPEERSDFVDTVFWQPALVLADGKGEVSFDLCDAVTSYQVTVLGHTLDGRIGATTSTIESRLPFTLEPKLPIEVTSNDKIDVPISIANNTSDARQVGIKVAANNLKVDSKNEEQLTINPDSRVRRIFRLQPSIAEGQATLRLEGRSDPFSDAVTRTFTVVPDGFPVAGAKSDLLEKAAQHEVVLPETWVPGTLKCQATVYPSTLADLQKGLDSLLREPHGCFEQTSSSNYPNALILGYLRETDQANPELERRARDLLARGYTKLVSFECTNPNNHRREGYEWFGGTVPPHEALTAYGLLEFRDMARVFDVDQKMVDRTRDYLMSRRDGKGGFARNPRGLDHIGHAPDDITNAYIVWGITESGKEDDVTRELAALATQAKTSKDPYFLSLVALSLLNRDQANAGSAILKKVADVQKDDGHLDAAQTSITGSGGRDLQIETTALAVLGWLKANRPADFNMPIQKAIKWIGQQRGSFGGYGSSQSTILALKALIAFTKANKQTSEAGNLKLVVGDKVVDQLNFQPGVQDVLVVNVPEPEKQLKAGKNPVRVEITGKNNFPYTLSWSYQTLKPANADDLPVRLGTRLDRDHATEGESVHLSVTVENTKDKGQGMAVAILGLPAGLTLPEDMKQLKDHARLRNDGKEPGLISAWETRGRELILYWRDLAPRQKIEVPVDLICRVPGEYRGPASRGYLYYNSDLKHWVNPLSIKIDPKAE